MHQLDYTRETIQILSRESNWFTFREVDFPQFALYLRRNYLEPSTNKVKISNRERRILNKYERALAHYWYAFPPKFHTHPLVKDCAFFFTCLFEIKSNKDRETILRTWSKISPQESSPFSHLKYYAPGDYRSLLAPRTKTQRFRIAQQLLQLFERSIPPSTTDEIDFKNFLDSFHRYVFYAPKVLTKNDFCLIAKIIEFQSDDQQLLGTHCKLNKNTVSTRLNWIMANHVLFHRRRILYNAFGLVPYLLLIRTKNKPFLLRDIAEMGPWILSEFIGSNKQQIHHLLVPNTIDGRELIEILVHDTLPSISQEIHLLQRLINHEFFLYNIYTYNLSLQKWIVRFNPSNVDSTNFSIIFPFEKTIPETFHPTRTQMTILNFFSTYPTATQRQACNILKLGTSTLIQQLKALNHHRIISDFFGIYPFDLPDFASFLISIKYDTTFVEILEETGLALPIIQGGRFIGEHQGIFLDIPFPSRQDIVKLHDVLRHRKDELFWFQVNEHPFASNWRFPLDFWNDETNNWLIKE